MENLLKNIVLDFTQEKQLNNFIAGQPLAILPAELTKKLLEDYSKRLRDASLEDIVEAHVAELREANSINDVLQKSISFIQERDLINNCSNHNFKPYEVNQRKAFAKANVEEEDCL
jgi:hypothetical protein